jgi:hypothetical protein
MYLIALRQHVEDANAQMPRDTREESKPLFIVRGADCMDSTACLRERYSIGAR